MRILARSLRRLFHRQIPPARPILTQPLGKDPGPEVRRESLELASSGHCDALHDPSVHLVCNIASIPGFPGGATWHPEMQDIPTPIPRRGVHSERLDPAPRAWIRTVCPMQPPQIRATTLRPVTAERSRVCAEGPKLGAVGVHGERSSLIRRDVPIRDGTSYIRRLPQASQGVRAAHLGLKEIESFKNEGRILQGLDPEQLEVQAVFRRVPIEITVRLRYRSASGLLSYTLPGACNLRQTRLHDLAALLDRSTGKIHLVPHRTRYRLASRLG